MIIGISGKLGSGKDTVANILRECLLKFYDLEFEKKAFAYKLKQIVALITGTTVEENLSHEGKQRLIKSFGMTLGQMQQKVGTECMRDNLSKEVWINALFADYKCEKDTNGDGDCGFKHCKRVHIPNWIVTDVRFKNEAQAILNNDGILIRIEGDPAGIRASSNRDHTHPSETDLDDFNFSYIIHNTGTIDDLAKHATELCLNIHHQFKIKDLLPPIK